MGGSEMDQTHENYSEPHDLGASRVWDTDQVSQKEAFDFYREGVCSAFMPLRPERPLDQSHPFGSRHVSHSLGDVALNLVTATPHPVFKDKRDIAASVSECYYVNLQLAGRCRITQANETIEITPGQIAIFDSDRLFCLDHGETETLQVMSLMVPKTQMSRPPTFAPQILSDHPVFGSALQHAATAIAPTVRDGDQDAVLRIKDIVLGLADLTLSGDLSISPQRTRRTAQYIKLCDLIRGYCNDTSVNVEQISAKVGLSVGTVRNIFTEHNDTFGRRLLHERIELAKRMLRNPRHSHLAVASVAYRCGFLDAAYFGRAFKDNAGLAPGAWRKSPT